MGKTSAFDFSDAIDQFAQARLGHQDRTRRLADSAQRISQSPAGTLPQKLHCPAAYRATLRLMNHPSLSHESVLAPHKFASRELIASRPSTVLIVHDATDLDYSGQATLAHLGQIGNGGGRGYLCHNSLAVDADSGVLLGLVGQILHTRPFVGKGEPIARKREREDRESRLWLEAIEASGPEPSGCHRVHVCDRGADTFEFLEYLIKSGRHFVIRSTHSRSLTVGPGEEHLLHDHLRVLPAMAGWAVRVSANDKQTARDTAVSVSWAKVTVNAPHVRKGDHGREPLELWAVRVWEPDPPRDAGEPLEWMLLTDEPITGEGSARRRAHFYELRPRVEELHKGMKTGMGIEQLQLQTRAGLEPLIALLSVLAVALVNAREAAADEERSGEPAREYFDPLWVMVLCLWRYKCRRPLTVREYIMALGRLGGHLNRKCDGLPGWITLWRGTTRLQTMVEYELSRQLCGKD